MHPGPSSCGRSRLAFPRGEPARSGNHRRCRHLLRGTPGPGTGTRRSGGAAAAARLLPARPLDRSVGGLRGFSTATVGSPEDTAWSRCWRTTAPCSSCAAVARPGPWARGRSTLAGLAQLPRGIASPGRHSRPRPSSTGSSAASTLIRGPGPASCPRGHSRLLLPCRHEALLALPWLAWDPPGEPPRWCRVSRSWLLSRRGHCRVGPVLLRHDPILAAGPGSSASCTASNPSAGG